jgi:hypothetical protein
MCRFCNPKHNVNGVLFLRNLHEIWHLRIKVHRSREYVCLEIIWHKLYFLCLLANRHHRLIEKRVLHDAYAQTDEGTSQQNYDSEGPSKSKFTNFHWLIKLSPYSSEPLQPYFEEGPSLDEDPAPWKKPDF